MSKVRVPKDTALWIRDWEWDKPIKDRIFKTYGRFSVIGERTIASIEISDKTKFEKYLPSVVDPKGKYIHGMPVPFKWLALLWIEYRLKKIGYVTVPKKFWSML